MSVSLDPARVRAAKSRARSHLDAAKLAETAARQARAKAEKLGEVWGFYVGDDEIGDARCPLDASGGADIRCLRPAGHEGECL